MSDLHIVNKIRFIIATLLGDPSLFQEKRTARKRKGTFYYLSSLIEFTTEEEGNKECLR
jgi:hypothetical protein